MEGSFIMANEMMKNRNNDNMMDQLSDWFSFPKDFLTIVPSRTLCNLM